MRTYDERPAGYVPSEDGQAADAMHNETLHQIALNKLPYDKVIQMPSLEDLGIDTTVTLDPENQFVAEELTDPEDGHKYTVQRYRAGFTINGRGAIYYNGRPVLETDAVPHVRAVEDRIFEAQRRVAAVAYRQNEALRKQYAEKSLNRAKALLGEATPTHQQVIYTVEQAAAD